MTQPSELVLNRNQISDALAGLGVDDLAKFRIASFLLAVPATRRTPAQIAEALGFRSTDRTRVALDQMARAGVLHSAPDFDGAVCYELPPESVTRLRATGAFGTGFQLTGPAIHALADKSLERIRARRRWVGAEPMSPIDPVDPIHA